VRRLSGRRILPFLPTPIHSPNRRWRGVRSNPFWWGAGFQAALQRLKLPGMAPCCAGRSCRTSPRILSRQFRNFRHRTAIQKEHVAAWVSHLLRAGKS
jgi:hypothetical protein